MGGFSVKLEGLKELDAKLTDLGGAAAKRVIRKALREGGAVIQEAIRSRAPERPDLPSGTALPPGALARDIELKLGVDEDGMPSALIAPGKYTAHIAGFVEYGHLLVKRSEAGTAKLKVRGGGKGVVVKSVDPHPFIRPGYESSSGKAVEVAIENIVKGIEKEAAKR